MPNLRRRNRPPPLLYRSKRANRLRRHQSRHRRSRNIRNPNFRTRNSSSRTNSPSYDRTARCHANKPHAPFPEIPQDGENEQHNHNEEQRPKTSDEGQEKPLPFFAEDCVVVCLDVRVVVWVVDYYWYFVRDVDSFVGEWRGAGGEEGGAYAVG